MTYPNWVLQFRRWWINFKAFLAVGTTNFLHFVHKAVATIRPAYRVFPPRAGDMQIQEKWMEKLLNCPVESVTLNGLKENRGFAGKMSKVHVETQNGPMDFIYKTSYPGLAATSSLLSMGTRREADFYHSDLVDMPPLDKVVPKCFYSYSSPFGEYVLLLEDVTKRPSGAIPVNYVFGNQIWGVPEGALPNPPNQLETLKKIFNQAAIFHVSHWRDPKLFDSKYSFLRGFDWYRASGRAGWETSIARARKNWNSLKSKKPELFTKEFTSMMDNSLDATKGADWHKFLKRLEAGWTLVHGDFHSANMFLLGDEVCWFDWSEVSIGLPMYDLAQLVISDVSQIPPEQIKEAVQEYYETWKQEMERLGKKDDSFTWDVCWKQFVRGGMAKWIWMLALMSGFPIPEQALQFWINQLTVFCKAFGNDVEAGEGRVGANQDACLDGWELGPVVLIQ